MEHFTILNGNENRFPVVVNIPHSGVFVLPHMRRRLLDNACLSNTDWFLPELYDFLPAMGCTTLINNLSRYVVDVNRALNGVSSGDYRNTVVYQENTQGRLLYSPPLNENEINERMTQYYHPYHDALKKLLLAKLQVYPSVLLLDLHSFFLDFVEDGNQDVYLSNRCGMTSSEQTLNELHMSFTSEGYSVLDNAIMGGHVIHHYRELLQERFEGVLIELRYTRYLDDRYFGEEEVTARNEMLFKAAKQKLKSVFMRLPFFQT